MLVLDDARADYKAFNVGTGQVVIVLDYFYHLARLMKMKVDPLIPGAYRIGDVRHTVSDISKLCGLGWRPAKGLQEIFEDYMEWLRTLKDSKDYFTPAYQAMRQDGIVRLVQPS
jgi:dTDP-L-rhamnose 4-epimerase